MNTQSIHGSRWWKFDFHAHTPKSDDYPDQTETPEQWLLTFMRAKIDAVVVSDHNSGEWVDTLKQGILALKASNDHDFRELTIFPGVELAVSGGTHVLLVLDPNKSTSDVAGLIRACGYTGAWGQAAGRATMSLEQVLGVAHQHSALVIPAHADAINGLWQATDYGSQMNALGHRGYLTILSLLSRGNLD